MLRAGDRASGSFRPYARCLPQASELHQGSSRNAEQSPLAIADTCCSEVMAEAAHATGYRNPTEAGKRWKASNAEMSAPLEIGGLRKLRKDFGRQKSRPFCITARYP
jgi:hypothetical protein